MQFEMKMPDLATTESDIRIVRWIVESGQKVERGQPLLEVETDKASMEVESVVSGVLAEMRAVADDTVSVGQVIAVLEVEGAASAATSVSSASKVKAAEPEVPRAESVNKPARAAAGMFARNRAAKSTPSTAPASGIPLTVAQRVAAKRLLESKQTIPHFYLQTSVNASAMIARRKAAEPAKLAWDAFFVKAVSKAIARYERFGCRLEGEQLTPLESDAIGVAVDHENELYVLPVAASADKTVEQISDDICRSVERLRGGAPEMRKIHPARLTISNLGVCKVESFVPIINPPEAAILGIGRVAPTPMVQDNGKIGVEPRCAITLSVDHRIASGKYAGDFLGAIIEELETI